MGTSLHTGPCMGLRNTQSVFPPSLLSRSAMNGGESAAPSKRPPNGLPKRPRLQMPTTGAQPADLRSLSELIGRGSSRAEQALGGSAPDDAWAAITSTVDNIAPTSTRPASILEEVVDLEDEGNDIFSNARADDDHMLDESKARSFPNDFSLKNSVDIVSARSLRWILRREQVFECAAVEQVACGDTSVPGDIRAMLRDSAESGYNDVDQIPTEEVQQEFSSSLLHFRHPEKSLPLVISKKWQSLVNEKLPYRARSSAGNGNSERPRVVSEDHKPIAVDRVETWQEAFRSLFYSYRHGYVGSFYVVLSTTVVFFGRNVSSQSGEGTVCTPSSYHQYLGMKDFSPGIESYTLQPDVVQSCSTLSAFFSRATAGLRELLSSFGVHYETKDGLTKDPEPCLIVDGEKETQALFNFICAVGPRLSNATDVPMLVCDWPFRGATLVSAVPVNARATRTTAHPVDEDALRHSIEVCGLFTPLQVARLYVALQCAQRSDFTLFMSTESKSSRLNICVAEQRNEKSNSFSERSGLGPSVVSRLQSGKDGKLSVYTRSAD